MIETGALTIRDMEAMASTDEWDFVYLLHFTKRIGQPQSAGKRAEYELPPRQGKVYGAGHYMGATGNLAARYQSHLHGNGANLVAVATAQGAGVELVRAWFGPRGLERRLKARKNHPRLCPCCSDNPYPAVYPDVIELSPEQIDALLIPF